MVSIPDDPLKGRLAAVLDVPAREGMEALPYEAML